MTNLLDSFGQSERGQSRRVNQDQFLVVDLDELNELEELNEVTVKPGDSIPDPPRNQTPLGVLLLVADGVGGAQAGDRASAIVANTVLNQLLAEKEKLRGEEHDGLLSGLPEVCHRALVDNVARHPERRGMGTTLTLAHFVWPHLSVVHVGDSRCYLLRDSTIRRLTHDQTIAEYMIERGVLDPHEARTSAFRRSLWSLVAGGQCEMKPEVSQLELEPDDLLLLCTDGLTNELSDDDLRDLLLTSPNAHTACERLIHAARDAGTTDDTTVVVARLRDTTKPASKVASIHLKHEHSAECNPFADTLVEALAG